MNQRLDETRDQLDVLIARHAARELDAQLGRAERRFRTYASAAPRRNTTTTRTTTRWAAWGAMAAAACAALVWLVLGARQQTKVAPGIDAVARGGETQKSSIDAGLVELERTLVWQTLDEGTLVIDNDTPLRKVRLQSLERVQWYDPANQALVEATVPSEEVIFVGMQTY